MPSIDFLEGFAASLALIIAIGAQNAFVLRQGLASSHVLPVVAVCALSDLVLIGAGVAGLGALVRDNPALVATMRWGGAAFLLAYAALALKRAWRPASLVAAGAPPMSRRAAVLAALGFTWLNPHCWLDTVLLLGSIAAQQPRPGVFAAGAMSASVAWFFALGYGARRLAPVFERPAAWRALDGGIALVMSAIAAGLIVSRPA